MKSTDAIVMDNWFPSSTDIMVRKGSAQQVAGMSGVVETMAAFRPEAGVHSLFAWSGTSVYDASGTGTVGAPVVSGLSNARWRHENFSTDGGHFLIAVNGTDDMLTYDGLTWTKINSLSSPSITNVLSSDLVSINIYKERPFYIEVGSMSAWYPPDVGTYAGALVELSLASVFKKGGYLMAMGTWTVDAGLGLDDYAVFITSQGEVAVFEGSDPGDANDWRLRGIYNLATPIGRDCMKKYGGDLLIITTDGVVPASRSLIDDRKSSAVAITDKIQGVMADSASSYKSNNGWSLTQFPGGTMLILNVPVAPGQQQQYVMNTVTGAWCRFTGWAASCFEILNDELYYGGTGEVVKAWVGTSDKGAVITTEVVQAFNYFGKRTQNKHFKMFRPTAAVDVNPQQIQASIDCDYVINQPNSAIDFPAIGGSLWDIAQWDLAVWGGLPTVQPRWYSSNSVGFCGAMHMKTVSNRSNIRLLAVDYVIEDGGVL